MKPLHFFPTLLMVILMAMPAMAGKKEVSQASPATFTIKGVIQDQATREKLAGVSVQVESGDFKVYTAPDGSFQLPGLASGSYSITFHCISYKDKKITIDPQDLKKGKLNLQLEPVTP